MTDDRTMPWYRRGPDKRSLPRGKVAAPMQLVGSDDVPLRVFLRRSAWDDMARFAETGGQEERGGILLGRPYEDDDGPFIVIEGAVPAERARPTDGGVTFTQQAWDEMKIVAEREFPAELVVGWFHTRPGHGVFLSGYDRFTAHRFFPAWWQLSYVMDPVRQRQGLFHWRDGDLQALPGFWVFADDAGAVGAPSAATVETGAARRVPFVRSAVAVAMIAILLAAVNMLSLPGSLSSLNEHVREHAAETARLRDELARLRTRHADLQQAVAIMEESESAQSPTTSTSVGASHDEYEDDASYVVRAGDTLWTISERLLGDAHAYTKVASQNELNDPNLILPGWELQMPTSQGDAAAGTD